MKKLFLLLTVLCLTSACSNNKEEDLCDCTEYQSVSISSKSSNSAKSSSNELVVINGSYSLTGNETHPHTDYIINGDLNLNGHKFQLVQGCLTVNGNLNGGGTLKVETYYVSGATQNNPEITGTLLDQPCNSGGTLSNEEFEYDPCRSYCLNK